MSRALTIPSGRRACLVLGHDGIDPNALDSLREQVPGLQLSDERQTGVLGALMRCWQTVDGFGPLKGHREGAQTPGAAHPWYGANRSDPGQLAARMGPALLSPAVWGAQDAGLACFVSSQVFWTWDDIRTYCSFFLRALPDGMLILPRGPVDVLAGIFAMRAGWSRDAAKEAVTLMAQHMDALADTWPERCLDWDVADPGSAAQLAMNLASTRAPEDDVAGRT